MKRVGMSEWTVLGTVNGADLELQAFQHPFLDLDLQPFVLGEHVTLEAGTGAVHTAPWPRSGRLCYQPEIRYGNRQSGWARRRLSARHLPGAGWRKRL